MENEGSPQKTAERNFGISNMNTNKEMKKAELPKDLQRAIVERELPPADADARQVILLAAARRSNAPAEIISVRGGSKQQRSLSPAWMYAAAVMIFISLTVLVNQFKSNDSTVAVSPLPQRMTQAERTELARMLLIDNQLEQTRWKTVAMRSRNKEIAHSEKLDSKLDRVRSRSSRLNRQSQIRRLHEKQLKQENNQLNYHRQTNRKSPQEA